MYLVTSGLSNTLLAIIEYLFCASHHARNKNKKNVDARQERKELVGNTGMLRKMF